MCLICLQIIVFLQLADVATETTFLVLVSNATVLLGGSVTLPCWLSPTTDAEGMEVRWYRDDNKMPVLHYHERKLQISPLMEKYLSRTALMPREPCGLKQGDVSLRIDNVSLNDAGKYVCEVRSGENYDRDTVVLKVEVCHITDSSGSSWMIAFFIALLPIIALIAFVSYLKMKKEAPNDVPLGTLEEGNAPSEEAPKDVPLETLEEKVKESEDVSIAQLLKRHHRSLAPKDVSPETLEEGNAPFKEEVDFMWCESLELAYSQDMKNHAVDILVTTDTAPACLKISPDGKKMWDYPGVSATDYERCVLGNQGFSSGQHYWEVGLITDITAVKSSWWVGVATDSAVQAMREMKSMPTSGLWCLYSDKKHGIHTKSGLSHYISMASRPEVLSIFLDYDNGWLSFYDTKKRRHLVTIKSNFREMVYPLFNPSEGDEAPLEILSRDKLFEQTGLFSKLLGY